jgi:hypothetical protein
MENFKTILMYSNLNLQISVKVFAINFQPLKKEIKLMFLKLSKEIQ